MIVPILINFSSQAVLSVMQQRNVSVNVQTFGCLALGCERQKDGLQLLKDMEVIKNKQKTQHTLFCTEKGLSGQCNGFKILLAWTWV